jgi:DNA-binding CsgD family transcriptional regulator
MTDDIQDYGATRAAIALFAVIVFLIGWDVIADYSEGSSLRHMIIEMFVLMMATSGAVLLWRQLHHARSDLANAQIEAERWRQESRELIRGLGVAIQNQFTEWQLSRAEGEIGLFLLKGFSHKEIAGIRQTSERTIREQARALYRKSGLSGRSSLSAFFLEDLLLPRSDESSSQK